MPDKLRFEIVTAERIVHTDDVDMVIAPGIEGELGILPQHAPLLTFLKPGELRVRKGNEETPIFVSGGFLEVQPDKVLVLADTAERAEEIDLARAEEARRRAEEALARRGPELDLARAEAAFQRASQRLRVARRRREGRGTPPPTG
jgi:F-type H+-transporting ATPase subunit epsilon